MSRPIVIIFLLYIFYFVQFPLLLPNLGAQIPNFQGEYKILVFTPSKNNQLTIPDYEFSYLNATMQSTSIPDKERYRIPPHGPFTPSTPPVSPAPSTPPPPTLSLAEPATGTTTPPPTPSVSIPDKERYRIPPHGPFTPSTPITSVDKEFIQKIKPSLYTLISRDIDKYKYNFDMIYQTCKAFPLSSCNTYLKEYNFEELKNISNAVKNNLNIYQKSPTTSVEQQFKLANLDLTSCFMDLSITTPKLLQSVLGQFDNILHSTIKSIFPGDDPIETIQKDFSMLLKINQQLGMPDPILNNCPQSFPS